MHILIGLGLALLGVYAVILAVMLAGALVFGAICLLLSPLLVSAYWGRGADLSPKEPIYIFSKRTWSLFVPAWREPSVPKPDTRRERVRLLPR